MVTKKRLLILIVLVLHYSNAQENYGKNQDSLSIKSYEYLSQAIIDYNDDGNKSSIYAKAWLKKAKSEENNFQIANAYKAHIHTANKNFRLLYADSMLIAAIKLNEVELIGSAYMTKGIVFYDRKEQMKALDNYLMADKYISQTKNEYLIYKLKYGIAQTKSYLGFYDEAISLFRECIDYFKEENDRAYLNSLHSLGLCYNRIGNYAWCTVTNQTGIDEGIRLNNLEMQPYFIHSEGINLCGLKKYNSTISKLTGILPTLKQNKDFANLSVAYFYIGKSFWSLNKKDKAITYFKKVEDIFKKENYIRPDLREGYEKLIDYYKQKGNIKLQLFYIDQLLKVDKILSQNYKYLLQKVVKEYDTKELLKSKYEIENTMTFRTIIGFSIICTLIAIIAFLINKHFKNKKLFDEIMRRDTSNPVITETSVVPPTFEKIINHDTNEAISSENTDKQSSQEISPDIETGILKKLEKFEQSKKYLEKDMTLAKMALFLNTNTKYVTKIIAKHRGKGTIDYITDLKINHIIEILKKETKYRNYTHKALGEEAGFGSTQNFTRAFKERNGISPTYFIYKLKKSLNEKSS
ncbi:AraC family transcriptional regulator [Flavobacterium sp.]|uniref:AraC family transcriptional regulator n=1 Tax=Flavobacterium sp. TaxID=239 RepID=UPI0026204F55|nr:AraC family transcriptional regulator [Flavobacterium sp.]